jgi:hypothetical protein
MTDDELIAGFESTDLPVERFSHAAHVRVAWWYVRHSPLPEALSRFITGLQRYVASKGAGGKYHETITVAYMLVIAQRVDGSRDSSWNEFAAAHPDLLVSKPSVLATYYSEALLASDRARRVFVMPDRVLDRDEQVPSASVGLVTAADRPARSPERGRRTRTRERA